MLKNNLGTSTTFENRKALGYSSPGKPKALRKTIASTKINCAPKKRLKRRKLEPSEKIFEDVKNVHIENLNQVMTKLVSKYGRSLIADVLTTDFEEKKYYDDAHMTKAERLRYYQNLNGVLSMRFEPMLSPDYFSLESEA